MGFNIFSVLNEVSGENSHALIPDRDPGSVAGSVFIQNNMNLTSVTRETNILHEFLGGNLPNFLRKFVPVTVTDGANSITYTVMSDYLCIGSDSDYVRMPMNPLTAQKIATAYDCSLPTRKMVNDIWSGSTNKLAPLPWGPPYDSDMEKTYRIGVHNQRIQDQLSGKDITALTSGHKKDVVLTNKLSPNNPNHKVAIYGWILESGNAIQGLNPISHADNYADYSHGIRLIANDVIVNGKAMRITDIFNDPHLSSLISDEGVLKFQKY